MRAGSVAAAGSGELRAEVPGIRLTDDPVGVKDLTAVIDDPTANRRRGNPIDAYLSEFGSRLTLHRIDFLRVYLTPSAEAARRLAAASAAARAAIPQTAAGRNASKVRRCLGRAGLKATTQKDSPKGVALVKPGSGGGIAMHAPLSQGNELVLVAYASTESARRSAGSLRTLLASVGGSAEAHGSLVVGYVRPPSTAEARLVEACT